jgi:hypothetical protein
VTLTIPDQSKLLAPQGTISFGSGGNGSYTINVNDSQTYQITSSLGSALLNAGLGAVKIFGYDHNRDNMSYPETVAASPYVSGVRLSLLCGRRQRRGYRA